LCRAAASRSTRARSTDRPRAVRPPPPAPGATAASASHARSARRSQRALSGAAPDAVLYDGVDGAHAVLPADLLPLFVGPAAVADRTLVDAQLHLGHLGGQLGLDAEAVLLDDDRLGDLAREGLVADLDVGEVEVVEHVRQQRQPAVDDHVPEIE